MISNMAELEKIKKKIINNADKINKDGSQDKSMWKDVKITERVEKESDSHNTCCLKCLQAGKKTRAVCHKNCNHKPYQTCSVFDAITGICNNCGCPESDHVSLKIAYKKQYKDITYDMQKVRESNYGKELSAAQAMMKHILDQQLETISEYEALCANIRRSDEYLRKNAYKPKSHNSS